MSYYSHGLSKDVSVSRFVYQEGGEETYPVSTNILPGFLSNNYVCQGRRFNISILWCGAIPSLSNKATYASFPFANNRSLQSNRNLVLPSQEESFLEVYEASKGVCPVRSRGCSYHYR